MPEAVQQIPVDRIDPSPYQPRRQFREEALAELAASIREHGILQPLVVRQEGPRYQVIAGERRLRAARHLGLDTVPALVRSLTDQQALEAALIENLQREDLSVVEAARAYERLIQEFGYTHAEVAVRLGKSRASVSNLLRLLQLPGRMLEMLDSGELTEGHARAILALPYASLQIEVAEWVARNAITVRETERKVRQLLQEGVVTPSGEGEPVEPRDAHVAALEERLRRRFGTKAVIAYRRGRGSITLEFYSDDDLLRLLELLEGAG